ncbi:MAG: folate-binding protein [Burkholderiaceae bacterium]|nr:folate-binding protein [Burkholderiaceae bacterium]
MLAAPPTLTDDSAARASVEASGARFALDAYGPQAVRDEPPFEALESGAVALLPDHGLLALTGEERVRFLHSMTTNDVEHQPASQARWHGLCTPKGRLLATMLAWRDPQAIWLLLPRLQAEPVRKRLSMYVLRAKVRIEDRSDAHSVLGVCGERALGALASLGLPAPAAFEVAHASPGTDPSAQAVVIGLAEVGRGAAGDAAALRRWLVVVPAGSLPAVWSSLAARLQPVGSAAWRWTDVRSGVARVVPATVEQFVPQMINFDAVGGVSFDKGCYPGQEIVARSHYLGKVKRRVFLAHLDGPEPAPGTEVVAQAADPVGIVAFAAPAPGGGTDLLVELQAAAATGTSALRIGDRPLRIEPLPYALPSGD